jgi:hypothetical protein
MAAVALNKFRTIRVGITTNMVGIYTCPIGVASIIILAQVTNIGTGSSVHTVSAVHSRTSTLDTGDYKFANNFQVPPNDSAVLIPDGRLALETNDVLKIQGSENGVLELVLSVLETAKQ